MIKSNIKIKLNVVDLFSPAISKLLWKLRLLRIIAWLKKYSLNLVLLLAILATILFLAYVNWTGGSL